jgi:hypothetical protein
VDSGLVSGFIRFDYKPQQITIAWNSFFDSWGISLRSAFSTALAHRIPLQLTWPPLLAGPAKVLDWVGSWTPTRTAFSELRFDLPLNSSLTLELLLTVLSVLLCLLLLNCPLRCLPCPFLIWGLAYSVLAWTTKRLPIVTLAEGIVDSLTWNANPQRVSYPRWRWVTLDQPMSGYCETHHTASSLRLSIPNSVMGIAVPFPMYPAVTLCYFWILAVVTLQPLLLLPARSLVPRGSLMRSKPIQCTNPISVCGAKTFESRWCPHTHPSPSGVLEIKSFSSSEGVEPSKRYCYSFLLVRPQIRLFPFRSAAVRTSRKYR